MGNSPEKKMTEEDRKNAILDIALESFSANGFNGSRIETIAKKAGLSYGAVYYYYPSKKVLFHMTVQRAMEESLALFLEIDESVSAYEQLINYTNKFLGWAATKHGAQSLLLFYQTLTAESIPDITKIYLKEKTEQIYSNIQKIMTGIKEHGLAKNKTAQELSSIFNALMIGYAFLRISKLDTHLPSSDLFMSFLT